MRSADGPKLAPGPVVAACLILLSSMLLGSGPTLAMPPVIEDPERIVGPETCQGCHVLEVKTWLESAHARLYVGEDPLHRRPRSLEIAKNLGVRLIKHDSLCLDCHFTPEKKGERVTARAGVSCESCHGAASSWVHAHNNFNGRDVHRSSENSEVTRRRVARNAGLGMNFSGTPYELIRRCFVCHLVPQERLVLDGGHPGGGAVPILERMHVIRHNFVSGERMDNPPYSADRQRRYLLLGAAAEIEVLLRALAEAERERSPYSLAKAQRLRVLIRQLGRMQRRQPLAEIDALLGAVEGLRYEAGNAVELLPIADRVASIGSSIATTYAGEAGGQKLAGLDPLLAGEVEQPVVDEPDDFASQRLGGPDLEEAGNDPDTNTDAEAGADQTAPAPAAGSGSGAEKKARARRAPRLPGQVAKVLRPPLNAHRILGSGRCGSCHGKESRAWFGGPHEAAATPFFESSPAVARLARTYYGRQVDRYLYTSKVVCMDCHGALASGATEADSGPTCESCHGPAGEYFDSHDKISRPQRFALGAVDLRDASARAEVCAGCHYISDPRLLASGHPSGASFELAERSRKIYHGKVSAPSDAALGAAWREAAGRRGPIPAIDVVTADFDSGRDRVGKASPDSSETRQRRAASSAPSVPSAAAYRGPSAAPSGFSQPGFSQPALAPPDLHERQIDLPPVPASAEELPLQALLELLHQRLDLLFEQLGGEP